MKRFPLKSLITVTLLASTVTVYAEENLTKPKGPSVTDILSQYIDCSPTITIRSQNLTTEQQSEACAMLAKQETNFHQLFNTAGKPVKHDNNMRVRVNVYQDRDQYALHAEQHFNIPTNNGGMYLEGYPDKENNEADFITYQRGDVIWNLRHEYVHYLDGRFNMYGDFCAALHDSHSKPENCPKPAPLYPHTVWWGEGVAEYVAKGKDNERALKAIKESTERYKLSDLFNTSYEHNGGGERVYSWGYAAVRFMMENHRDKIETMLQFMRTGDYPRYQALIKEWDTTLDAQFDQWLTTTLTN